MERRLLLALLLSGVVIVMTPKLFPPAARPPVRDTLPSDASGQDARRDSAAPPPAGTPAVTEPGAAAAPRPVGQDTTFRGVRAAPAPAPTADTLSVAVPEARYRFAASFPALVSSELPAYRSHRAGDGPVQLMDPDGLLIDYALALGRDTVPFAAGSWTAQRTERAVRYAGAVGSAPVEVAFEAVPDSYVLRVTGRIAGNVPAQLLIRMPSGFVSQETDTLDDLRSLAFAGKPLRRDGQRIGFGSLDPGEEDTIPGPLQWAVAKNKYFLVAVLAPAEPAGGSGGEPLGALLVTGGRPTGRVDNHAIGVVSHPAPAGAFSFEIYAGPQEWRRLHGMGRDFENANPYGGFMQGIVQPFATIVMRALLWMKEATRLSYGWVLVLFGIAVRVLMWPLQQSAMRTSVKMQRIHPEIQEVQKRYASDQRRMQQELMRVYREHGMTPLSPLAGCLPMLLPMPILFALFFVFQNTIEFRGVPFFWLPDISLKDPYYIIPIAMGISMFALSWVGMKGVPPNPQTKMMAYVMPVTMTVVFLNFASGLNLYYTVQNIVGIPQQWLISRERGKMTAAGDRGGGGGGGGGGGASRGGSSARAP